jgi:hypothetical protein
MQSTIKPRVQTQSEQEAYEIAKDAYVYAYPLVLYDATKWQSTNFAEPTGIPTQASTSVPRHRWFALDREREKSAKGEKV